MNVLCTDEDFLSPLRLNVSVLWSGLWLNRPRLGADCKRVTVTEAVLL